MKSHLIKDGLGVVRGEKGYSYIVDKKTPAPGGYDMKDVLISPSRSIHCKILPGPSNSSLKPTVTSPGPGHYDLVKPIVKDHNWDLVRLKAENFRDLRRQNIFRKNA